MKRSKTLKLPDGGTLEIAMPPEFGSTILALNDAGSISRRSALPYLIGAIAGMFTVWITRKLAA